MSTGFFFYVAVSSVTVRASSPGARSEYRLEFGLCLQPASVKAPRPGPYDLQAQPGPERDRGHHQDQARRIPRPPLSTKQPSREGEFHYRPVRSCVAEADERG